jgi:hypothetical protein
MICINSLGYWAFIGTLYLIMLTYSDIKNKMVVDDRHNYMMFGVTFSLIFILHRSLLFILLTLAIIIGLNIFMNKVKVLGDGDTKSITWILYGYSIINMFNLIWFFIMLTSITIIFWTIVKGIFKVKGAAPFYPVILLSFILTNLITGRYIS